MVKKNSLQTKNLENFDKNRQDRISKYTIL